MIAVTIPVSASRDLPPHHTPMGLALGLVAAVLAAGCGPAVRLDPPAGWPQHWAERSLYHTPNAYVYAGSDAAAGEVDRLVEQRAERFREQYGREPAKGLLIVTGKNDEPFTADLRSLMTIVDGEGISPVAVERSEDAGEHEQLILEGLASALGVDVSLVYLVAALPLDPAEMRDLIGIPADQTDTFGWAAAVPTRNAARGAVRSQARRFAKNYLGFFGRIVAAPLLPLAVDRASKELLVQWEETIDEQLQGADPQLAPILPDRQQELGHRFDGFEDFTLEDLGDEGQRRTTTSGTGSDSPSGGRHQADGPEV
jgi:hypothetical protein